MLLFIKSLLVLLTTTLIYLRSKYLQEPSKVYIYTLEECYKNIHFQNKETKGSVLNYTFKLASALFLAQSADKYKKMCVL